MLLSSSEENKYTGLSVTLPKCLMSLLRSLGSRHFTEEARWLILGARSDQGKLADSNKGPVGSSEKLLIIEVLQPTNASKDI